MSTRGHDQETQSKYIWGYDKGCLGPLDRSQGVDLSGCVLHLIKNT